MIRLKSFISLVVLTESMFFSLKCLEAPQSGIDKTTTLQAKPRACLIAVYFIKKIYNL